VWNGFLTLFEEVPRKADLLIAVQLVKPKMKMEYFFSAAPDGGRSTGAQEGRRSDPM
jgi:hypothetical protein